MKKFLFFLFVFFSFAQYVGASTSEIINSDSIVNAQSKIDEIGFRILNSNGIEKRMVFDYNTKSNKNASSRYSDRQIILYRGLYNRLNSDDEIAAVLAHEISHAVDSYNGIFRGYFSNFLYSFAPKKYEYKADKKAVDYIMGGCSGAAGGSHDLAPNRNV